MKLRNKKTGDIWEFDGISMAISDSTKEKLGARGCSGACYARSLSELNEEWEDVKPAEPLIKDEKIRKAVREWADTVGADKCTYDRFWETFRSKDTSISFAGVYKFELEDERNYTIAELCGEEEECYEN